MTQPPLHLDHPGIATAFTRLATPLAHCRLERLAGRHLLLTGATGFFGKWVLVLCDWLNRQGIALQVSATSRAPERFLRDLPYYASCPWLTWQAVDLMRACPDTRGIDYLLHCATDSSATVQARRLEFFSDLLRTTENVLAAAAAGGVARSLLVGSGAQYGVLERGCPVAEDWRQACLSNRAQDAYAEGKRVQEMLGVLHAEQYGLEVVFARAFAFLGPGLPLDGHFAAGNFLRDALLGEAIVLQSQGSAVRSYLYGADLAIWLLVLLLDGESGQAYNVGSDEGICVFDLALRMRDLLAPCKAVHRPPASADAERGSFYVPAIAKSRALGLDIWTTLDQAILESARWQLSAF